MRDEDNGDVMYVFPFEVIWHRLVQAVSVQARVEYIWKTYEVGGWVPNYPNLEKFGPVRACCSAIPNAACGPKSNHGISEQIRGKATMYYNICMTNCKINETVHVF